MQATPFLQAFDDEDDDLIQRGFQLWLQFRVGYRLEPLNKRLFFEPSVVCDYWPVNTGVPKSFAEIEDEWPNYFLLEPGCHFGFRF